MRRWSIVLKVALVLGAGFESRAGDYSSDYLLFSPFYESTKAWACDMDSSGTLSFREEYEVGYDSLGCKASPNGQLMTISSIKSPKLSCFFIDRERNISPPIYNNQRLLSLNPLDQILYHPYKPYLYLGFHPHTDSFKIDYHNKTVEKTGFEGYLNTDHSNFWDFSKWAGGIVFPQNDRTSETIGVGFIKVSDDGGFTTQTSRIDLGGTRFSSVRSLTVSPNGRFIAVLNRGAPIVYVLEINREGDLRLIYKFSEELNDATNGLNLMYTPDGRNLFLACEDPNYTIISFSVDPFTGEHTLHRKYGRPDVPFVTPLNDVAMTPDGRFLILAKSDSSGKYFYYIIEIGRDGNLNWLKDKTAYIHVPPWPSQMGFVPPWRETIAPPHGFLLH